MARVEGGAYGDFSEADPRACTEAILLLGPVILKRSGSVSL